MSCFCTLPQVEGEPHFVHAALRFPVLSASLNTFAVVGFSGRIRSVVLGSPRPAWDKREHEQWGTSDEPFCRMN